MLSLLVFIARIICPWLLFEKKRILIYSSHKIAAFRSYFDLRQSKTVNYYYYQMCFCVREKAKKKKVL